MKSNHLGQNQESLFKVLPRVVIDLSLLTHILSPDPSGTNSTSQKGRWRKSGTVALKETSHWSPQKLKLHPRIVLVCKELKPANGEARKDTGCTFIFHETEALT